jgi:Tfp pilus assembly protein PilE
MLKLLRVRSALTATEVVIALVILVVLSVIAVPNYYRIRMKTNMELVKQNLRVIGQEMSEIYNQTKRFPASLEEIKNSALPQEISITESLSAIHKKGYDLTYLPSPERTSYMQRAEPFPETKGISGYQCFILDPAGLRDVPCWSGEGKKMEIWGYPYLDFAHLIQFVLTDSELDSEEKATILAGMIEYFTRQAAGNLNGKLNDGQSPAYAFPIFESVKDAFEAIFPKVYDILRDKGVRIYGTFHREPSLLKSGHLELPVQAGEYHVGVQIADVTEELVRDKEFQIFYDYVQKVCSGRTHCNDNLDSWNSHALILSS